MSAREIRADFSRTCGGCECVRTEPWPVKGSYHEEVTAYRCGAPGPCQGFVARDICARYEITFNEAENPTTDLLNGKITFHQYLTPYVPAEDIENILEFDPDALSKLFG